MDVCVCVCPLCAFVPLGMLMRFFVFFNLKSIDYDGLELENLEERPWIHLYVPSYIGVSLV